MPRFFFRFRSKGQLDQDDEGMELRDAGEALQEAEIGARGILAERLLAGKHLDGETIEILDEERRCVGVISLKDVIKKGMEEE
jgi:hypothetical protein